MNRAITKRTSHSDFAYQELKRRILDNELPPGSQYLEQEIARLLNMSRTPVRECLQRLASEGLVEIIPRHGIRILPLSSADMAEIYLILTGLEAAAVELVAQRGLDAGQIQQLNEPLDDMDHALVREDLVAWAHADERFHKLLVELTNNKRLIAMVQMLWDQSHRARMTTLKLRPKPRQSNKDHRALVDAITNRDPELAWKIHTRHRRNSGAMLVKLLEDLGLKQV